MNIIGYSNGYNRIDLWASITNIFSAQRNTEKSYVIIPLPSFLFIGFNMLINLILKRKISIILREYKGFFTKLYAL